MRVDLRWRRCKCLALPLIRRLEKWRVPPKSKPVITEEYRPWKDTRLGHKTWRNQASTDLEDPSLLSSFHGARRCHVGCREEKSSNPPIQLWTLQATIKTGLAKYTTHSCNVTRVTNYFLFGFKSMRQDGTQACYCTLDQEPMAG